MGTLTVAAVRKQIADGATDPIYLLQGEDEAEKSALALEFEQIVEEGLRAFNVEHIHVGDLTSGDKLANGVAGLVAAVRTLPMMVPRRVVTVHQAETLLAPKRESEASTRALDDRRNASRRRRSEIRLLTVHRHRAWIRGALPAGASDRDWRKTWPMSGDAAST